MIIRNVRSTITTRSASSLSILPSFQQLSGAPPTPAPPAAVSADGQRPRRTNRERRLTTAFDVAASNDATAAAATIEPFFSTYPRPSPAAPRPPVAAVSQYLPLVTRERNHLISLFHLEIYGNEHHPDRVWSALTQLLQYPALQPRLPRSCYRTPDRSLAADDDENGERLMDTRSPISLSLPELRRTFTILSCTRPPTRAGLSKLIVLVELLAMRSSIALPAVSLSMENGTGGGRDAAMTELRGAGVGLRPRDWEALILFASRCYRSPRPTHEIASATALFTQWTRHQRSPNGQSFKPPVSVYNNLMHVASKARSWELYEAVKERMKDEGIEEDSYSLRILMGIEEMRGAHIESIWSIFLQAIQRCLDLQQQKQKLEQRGAEMSLDALSEVDAKEWTGLWNQMVWIYAKRGLMSEAMEMYRVMVAGDGIDLRRIAPTRDDEPFGSAMASDGVYKIVPPPPQHQVYSSLIQAFSHQGDLRRSLTLLKDLLAPTPRPSAAPLPSSSTEPLPAPSSPDPIAASSSPSPSSISMLPIYTSLFRGFATHSQAPSGSSYHALNPLLLTGQRVGTNRTSSLQMYDTLRRFTTPGRSLDGNESTSLAWSIEVLESVFRTFLTLSPPSPKGSSRSRLPHAGTRTAPSPKTIWWIILAFDKLSGGDTARVLRVWYEIEHKFAEGGEKQGWTGWRSDARMMRTVERMKSRRIKEMESEREEQEEVESMS